MSAPDPPSQNQFEFAGFRFDASERVLYRGSERVPLAPKAADTLLVLLTHHGRVVEKGRLIQLVWPDTFVEEGGLARNISALRKALGDDAEGAAYIETVPKRGYRFAAPLKQAAPGPDTPAGPPPASPPGPRRYGGRAVTVAVAGLALLIAGACVAALLLRNRPAARVTSIAVLPLKNLSGSLAQDYFSEGLTDLIATELARTGLQVIAPASIRRLPPGAPLNEIGRLLKVQAMIQGTVLESGGQVRITAQMVDAASGRLLWGNSYQRDMRDILGLQAEVAGAVARETSVEAAKQPERTRPRTVVPEAYQAYLRGRFFWNKRSEAALRKAIECFNEAIEKDPSYAPAHSGLADSWSLLASNFYDAVPPLEAMPRARVAAVRALELDEASAEAHTSLAYVLMAYDHDLEAADRQFRRALRLNPGYATAHHWHAHCLLAGGRIQEAEAEMGQARNLDPLSLPVNVGWGWCAYFARRYEDAIRRYRAALELEPGFAMAHQTLGMALARKGDYPDAIGELRKAVALSENSPSAVASLGYAHALAGSTAAAGAELARLSEMSKRRYVPAIYMALVHLGLGDAARFRTWFLKARAERSEYLIYYRHDPVTDGVRNEPNFRAALELTPTPLR